MFGERIKEVFKGQETERHEAEVRVQRYADLLLQDPEGNDRAARAEHILPEGAEPGYKTAQAVFYRDESGGFVIDEYRDGGLNPVFTEYMLPYEVMYPDDNRHLGARWATGMIRHHFSRFSKHHIDDPALVANVLEAFFGKLPD